MQPNYRQSRNRFLIEVVEALVGTEVQLHQSIDARERNAQRYRCFAAVLTPQPPSWLFMRF